MMRLVPLSCCRNNCVLRAIRAEKSVGSASASSSALVCSDWVWPCVAAIASMVVRITLLKTSCAVSDQPEVWQCVRSDSERGSFGLNCVSSLAHNSRAARILATSMKKFMPIAQKNDSRGAKRSTSRPAAKPGAQIFDAVGQRIGEFEVLRRAGFLHVIAGDRDGVVLRHFLRGVRKDVGDDPHRGRRRIDVGVAHHELFQNVVLNGARQFLRRNALFLGGRDEQREDRQHRAVHGHRHAHLVERNACRTACACRRSKSIATPAMPTSPVTRG